MVALAVLALLVIIAGVVLFKQKEVALPAPPAQTTPTVTTSTANTAIPGTTSSLVVPEEVLTTQSPSELARFVVNPQTSEGALGRVTFSRRGELLFHFAKTPNTGVIVIDNTEYVLNRLSLSDAGYGISGAHVSIRTSEVAYVDKGGDCAYGTLSTVTITLKGVSQTLDDVELQDCPDLDF